MKNQVLHTVWCNISAEAAGEIWDWSLLGSERANRGVVKLFSSIFEPAIRMNSYKNRAGRFVQLWISHCERSGGEYVQYSDWQEIFGLIRDSANRPLSTWALFTYGATSKYTV